jgi:glycosyltransferase involved in cell wall biosynthesis
VARLVEDSGCGFRVDAGDPKRLAAEILRLADDSARAGDCARRARTRAEVECSRELAVDRYEELLEGIVRSSRRGRLPT